MRLYSLFVILSALLLGCSVTSNEKKIYGYVEKATLMDANLTVSAKLDTGAKSSSLSAIHIQEIEQNGKIFLQFVVPSKSGNVTLLSEYVGKVKIKPRAGETASLGKKPSVIKRPVVLLRILLD